MSMRVCWAIQARAVHKPPFSTSLATHHNQAIPRGQPPLPIIHQRDMAAMLCHRASSSVCGRSTSSSRQCLSPATAAKAAFLRPQGLRSSAEGCLRLRHICRAGLRTEDDDFLLAAGCPVPSEQQPMNELKQLQEMFLFDWATMPVQDFATKLVSVWVGFYVLLGLPVSAFTFDVHKELLQCLAAASAGSTFIVTVLVWRLYLGWQHVGDRLISATVEYEETGWYDGQTWVKTPQVLMRDRLMSNYTVKPALARLKRTLLGLGGALVTSMMLLALLPPPPVNSASYYDYSSYAAASSSSYSSTVSSRDYDEAVAKYEPWAAAQDAVEDGEEQAPRYDIRTHMMLSQQ